MSLLNKNPYAMDSDADGEVAEFIIAKGYLPNEKDLPKTSILKNVGKYFIYTCKTFNCQNDSWMHSVVYTYLHFADNPDFF